MNQISMCSLLPQQMQSLRYVCVSKNEKTKNSICHKYNLLNDHNTKLGVEVDNVLKDYMQA